MKTVTKIAVNFNGISIAYMIGLVNACMAVAMAFGLALNDTQQAAIVGLVNAALVLAVHLGHRLGEASISDATHELGKAKLEAAAAPTESA